MGIKGPGCNHYGIYDNSASCYYCDVDDECKKLSNYVEPVKNDKWAWIHNIKAMAERIKAGEQVELFAEDVGAVLEEMFGNHEDVHVEVFISESVTWIRRKENDKQPE